MRQQLARVCVDLTMVLAGIIVLLAQCPDGPRLAMAAVPVTTPADTVPFCRVTNIAFARDTTYYEAACVGRTVLTWRPAK